MATLGATYKDKITGFQGIATGYVQYITGCNQVLLVPPVSDTGALISAEWFDEQRVDKIGETAIKLNNDVSPGFDKPAPKR